MPEVDQIQVENIVYDIRDSISRQRSVPSGGTAGQILKKSTSTDYDASWQDLPSTFPPSEHNHDDRYYTESEINTLLEGYTSTTVLPNDFGDIKTKYRIAMKTTTGSSSTWWYFPLVKFPATGNSNYASAIITGRIGGWTDSNINYFQGLFWNRNATGISSINISGGATTESSYFNVVDFVVYKNGTTNEETIYIKCNSYFAFDINVELFQSTASIIYDGTYLTEEPSGTLTAQASTSAKRMSWTNGKLLLAGSDADSKYAAASHNHDDKYYTTTSTNSLLSVKAPLDSPAFTGTPTAPTAADGTNTTQIATTQFVQNAFKTNDAMVFKGTIGSSGATVTSLPATHYQGWTYKVATAGTYVGTSCEIGDMIICITDGTSANNAHWTVIQSNIDGAVTGPTSATDAHVVTFNGTSGKIIKDSGYTIGKSVPSDAKFTDTTYSQGTGITISGTTISNAGVRSITTGSSNGTISVNTNGTATEVAVKGLGTAAYSATTDFAAASHNHDLRYYTTTEIDTALSTKVDISSLSTMAYISDAPYDNIQYARKNGEWSRVLDIYVDCLFYVNPSTGSDTNSGTSTSPFKTITHAIDNIPTNGCGYIILSGGTYSEDIFVGDYIYQQSKTIKFNITGNITVNGIYCYNGCNIEFNASSTLTVTCKTIQVSGGSIKFKNANIAISGASASPAINVTNGGQLICNEDITYQGSYSNILIGSVQGSYVYVNNVIISSGYSTITCFNADYGGTIIYVSASGYSSANWKIADHSGIIAKGFGDLAFEEDVPSDSREYIRKNGYWDVLPIASTTKLGNIKIGEGLSVTTDGTLSAIDQNETLYFTETINSDIVTHCIRHYFFRIYILK